jgi:hypothetical protein
LVLQFEAFRQLYGEHEDVPPGVDTPAPLQVLAKVNVLPEQLAGTDRVPLG